jgi:hypothetical protein
VGRRASEGWGSISLHARRRLVALLAVAAAVVAVIVLAVPNLPCEFPGGDSCPPTDDAAQIIPAGALAYVHVNLDPDTEQYELAAATVAQVPLFTQQLTARAAALLPSPAGPAPEFARDIAPWFGGEIALAMLRGPGDVDQRVVALEVGDSEGASGYAAAIATGQPTAQEYRGFEVMVDERRVASVEIGGFLVIGARAAVREVIETASGDPDAPPIGGDAIADEVRDQLPDHRLAEAYVSPKGAATLLEGSGGALGALSAFVAPGATRGAAAALAFSDGALELSVRSALDPERERGSSGLFAAFEEFDPQLAERLSPEALAYLGLGAPGRTLRTLIARAAAGAPGIAASFADLVKALEKQEAVDLEADLLDSLGDEAALAIEPPAGAAGLPRVTGVPYLQFIARGVDEDATRRALAGLQAPIAKAAAPANLKAPVFSEQEVGGASVRSLRISPVIDLAYAVFDGLVVIATDPAGIAEVASGRGGLDDSGVYQRATDGFADDPSLIAFFDLRRLLAQGFAIGLAQVPAFNTFADDFRHLEALGLEVRASDDSLATDARLVFGEPDAEQPAGLAPSAD